jgi:hypothetical protein
VAQAKHAHPEKYYQRIQCNIQGGIIEYHPKRDRWVRVDCLTDEYAIEVDFSSAKQYEAIGQSLYYSALTGKKAGVWLIVEKPNDIKHAIRMVRNIRMNNLPITVWIIRNNPTAPTFELYYEPKCSCGNMSYPARGRC